jgi:hypothetical protein
VRRNEGYRAVAEAIQQRHGSRRSGMRQTGQRLVAQIALDLEP